MRRLGILCCFVSWSLVISMGTWSAQSAAEAIPGQPTASLATVSVTTGLTRC